MARSRQSRVSPWALTAEWATVGVVDTEPERDHISPAPPPSWSESAGSTRPPPPPPWSPPAPDATSTDSPSSHAGPPGPPGLPGAAGPGPAWTAGGDTDDSGSPPWGPPGPLGPPPPGRYGRYGYRPGRPRRYRGRTPVAAGWRYVLLALGIVTLGFAWLLGAILCWVGFFRTRRRAGSGPPAAPVHWLRWAVIFSVLGLIVVPLSLNAVINGNNSRSGSGSSSPPFTMKTVPLGTPVAVRTDLGVDLQMVPATVTATAVQPAPATGGTATVDLKVCATTQSVDPSFAADGLELGTTGSNNLVADTNLLQASSTFGQVLPPGHCTTGSVPFSVPANTNVTSVQLPSLEVGATWTLS